MGILTKKKKIINTSCWLPSYIAKYRMSQNKQIENEALIKVQEFFDEVFFWQSIQAAHGHDHFG
jgi:hypothetical protein